MSAPRSIPRRAADDNQHPIHRADCRIAQIRAGALCVLLLAAAVPFGASLISILVLTVRP